MKLLTALAGAAPADRAFLLALLEEGKTVRLLASAGRRLAAKMRARLRPDGGGAALPDREGRVRDRHRYRLGQPEEACFEALVRELRRRVGDRRRAFSPEAWERRLVEAAARDTGCNADQPSERLVPQVITRFLESLVEELDKKPPEEKARWEARLDTALGRLGDEERRTLLRVLGMERLTAGALLRLCREGGLTASLLVGLNTTGFGVYLALSTLIHTFATTLLGLTVPWVFYAGAMKLLAGLLSPVGGLALFGLLAVRAGRRHARAFTGRVAVMTLMIVYERYGAAETPSSIALWDGWGGAAWERWRGAQRAAAEAKCARGRAGAEVERRYTAWEAARKGFHAAEGGDVPALRAAFGEAGRRLDAARAERDACAARAAEAGARLAAERERRILDLARHLGAAYPSLTVEDRVIEHLAVRAGACLATTAERRLADLARCPALGRLGGRPGGGGPCRIALEHGGTLEVDPERPGTVIRVR